MSGNETSDDKAGGGGELPAGAAAREEPRESARESLGQGSSEGLAAGPQPYPAELAAAAAAAGTGPRERGQASHLAEDIARGLFLNSKKLPKRSKHWALTYDAYLGLAVAVVELLRLSGWRFTRKPRKSPHETG